MHLPHQGLGFRARLGLPVGLRQQQVRQVVLVQLQHVAGHAEGALALMGFRVRF